MENDFEKTKESIWHIIQRTEWEGRDEFLQRLNDIWTTTELVYLTSSYLEKLFYHADEELWDVLSDCLDAKQTLSAGYLLNPSEIPRGRDPLYVICQDPTKVTQKVNRIVAYYGDVDLTVKKGTAIVYGTSYIVTAGGDARVEVFGKTEVACFDRAQLLLHDLTVAELYDKTVAYATDKSYVKASDQSKVVASDEAQFYLLKGKPSLEASDSARGIVSLDIEKGTSISLTGDALLYSFLPEPKLSIERKDYRGTAIFDAPIGLGIQDKIIARDTVIWYPEEGYEPRSVEAIREAILSFQPGNLSLRFALDQADSIEGLCEEMMPFIPRLIGNGMDGKFLRQHFPENVLEDNLIHAFSRPMSSRDNLEVPGVHFFFGTQLVYPERCAGETRCYERTLTIQRGEADDAFLYGTATGIVMDGARLFATGNAVAFGMDGGTALLGANANGYFYGSSKAKAFGQSLVHGYEGSFIEAAGESRLYAMSGCRANASEKAVVLAYPGSTIDASGDAVVGYVSERDRPMASISLSGNARKEDAISFGNFIDFMRIFDGGEKTRGVHR